jgi:hypothetical protein
VQKKEGGAGGPMKLRGAIASTAISCALAALVIPGAASGAVTVGETFDASASGSCTNGTTALQTTSPSNQYIVPTAGVLTSWSFFATDALSVTFKIARPTGNPNEFQIVGSSEQTITTLGLNTFDDISFVVQAGDLLGLYSSTGGDWCLLDNNYGMHRKSGDTPQGTVAVFPDAFAIRLNVSASLEADCDGDGLGDETEDQALTDPSCPQPPAPQPGPDPQPQQPTPKADGTLTIDANKGKVEKGRKVLLSGQLDVPSNESCEQNRQVQVQRRLKSEDDSKFATFQMVQTDPTGNYSLKVKVKKTYFYRAVVTETDACDDETSNSQKVRVQKKKAAQEA